MNYSGIKTFDIANGTGVRTSLFVSGCRHHCKGCFQPETWDFNNGKPFDKETWNVIFDSCDTDRVAGLTLLGGEPFEPENQRDLLDFVKEYKSKFPEKNIWAYTGYTLESDLLDEKGKARCEATDELLSMIDILVDGEFIEEQKDITLKFRGSKNQRILDLKELGINKH